MTEYIKRSGDVEFIGIYRKITDLELIDILTR